MKKIATITGWIAIAAFIAFSVDYISSLPDQAQRADWGIAKDSPLSKVTSNNHRNLLQNN